MQIRRRLTAKLRWELKKLLWYSNTTPEDRLVQGRGTYGASRATVIYDDSTAGMVRIGNYCSIAANVEFLLTGNHRTDWVTTYPIRTMYGMDGAGHDGHPWTKGDIVIGNDVWVGTGAKVLNGVTIGNGAVVAAYSVVVGDVPPYGIVAGVPATLKRFRFPEDVRDGLERTAWWDWSEDTVRERVADLCSPDVEAFVAKYEIGR